METLLVTDSDVAPPQSGEGPKRGGHRSALTGPSDETSLLAGDDALLRRFAQTRDPRLKEELVKRFLPLARSLALRYRGASEQLEDLIQVASLGLVNAIDENRNRRCEREAVLHWRVDAHQMVPVQCEVCSLDGAFRTLLTRAKEQRRVCPSTSTSNSASFFPSKLQPANQYASFPSRALSPAFTL